MSIPQILALTGLAVLLGLLRRGRALVLMGFSVLVIYWLQPESTVFASLSFWLPTLTIFITGLVWVLTAPTESRSLRANWSALVVLTGVIVIVVIGPNLPWLNFPASGSYKLVAIVLMVMFAFSAGLSFIKKGERILLPITALGLLAIFVFLKSPWVSEHVLSLLASLRGRTLDPAVPINIAWLGYSYIAFRLLHTIRDRQTGVLPAVGLAEYINYVIFFPAFVAGPIDRLERFIKELRSPLPLKNEDWLFAGQRLAMGLFKKFFMADLLALISVKDVLVDQTLSGGWLWLTLCAYSFRVYFDFSGYTDIAIGMGRLMGIRLPENFASPFLKSNLTQLWNSWHITLTQWFRSYFFFPFTRLLRSSNRSLPQGLIIFLGQLGTMLLIGMWHGITWNYALWGLWHGLGLFLQNRWSEFIHRRYPNLGASPVSRRLLQIGGILLTFTYFTFGIAFFALSTPQLSFEAIRKIFGIS
jgi:alginate O-acetyltransferase complex protein AlgI